AGAGVSGAALPPGLGRQREREVDPPNRALRSTIHDPRGDVEVHRADGRRHGAQLQFPDGRAIADHLSGVSGDAHPRLGRDQRHRMDRFGKDRARRREHRWRRHLDGGASAGSGAAEGAHALPPSVELDWRRSGDHEPRRRRDRIRAADARDADQDARLEQHRISHQSDHRLADRSGRRGRLSRGAMVMMRRTVVTAGFACGLAAVATAQPPAKSGAKAPAAFGIGRPATPAEIAAWDIDIGPDGTGLPPGRGTAADGAPIFAARCAGCHGKTGKEGPNDVLVGRLPNDEFPFARDPRAPKTIGSYWPYATTVFDYIRRAMPPDKPGSLNDDEVYNLTAFLLAQNELIAQD